MPTTCMKEATDYTDPGRTGLELDAATEKSDASSAIEDGDFGDDGDAIGDEAGVEILAPEGWDARNIAALVALGDAQPGDQLHAGHVLGELAELLSQDSEVERDEPCALRTASRTRSAAASGVSRRLSLTCGKAKPEYRR